MSDQTPREIALTVEAEALHAEIVRLRIENEALRRGRVEARHHIALALCALNSDHLAADREQTHG